MILDPEGPEVRPEIARLTHSEEGDAWWQLWKEAIFYWDGGGGGAGGGWL